MEIIQIYEMRTTMMSHIANRSLKEGKPMAGVMKSILEDVLNNYEFPNSVNFDTKTNFKFKMDTDGKKMLCKISKDCGIPVSSLIKAIYYLNGMAKNKKSGI